MLTGGNPAPFINGYRSSIMGFAMLLVVLYHAFCISRFFIPFMYGYIGGDIFFLLTGMGLSRSYSKHRWSVFIKNRISRIFPLFFLYATLKSIYYWAIGQDVTFIDYLCNITTLSYFVHSADICSCYSMGKADSK